MLADPSSKIFPQMAKGNDAVTEKAVEIREYQKEEIHKAVSAAPFWSYLFDEGTDISTKEQLLMYVRFVDMSSEKLVTTFAGVKEIKGHPTAQELVNQGIKPIFQELRLPMDHVVGQTSDGASAVLYSKDTKNTGQSVSSIIAKEFNSQLFKQHCGMHRLNLVAKDGQKKIPLFVETTMKKLFNHFKYSNVAQSVLKMIAEVNNEEFHMMVAFHKPRFISLQPVVAKVIELVESETLQNYFRHSIENARDASKRRELRQLETAATDTKFLLYVYFLGGCLPLLAEVNTKCQKRSALIWETYRELEKLIRVWIEPIVVDTSKLLSEVLEDENLKLASVDLFDEEALEDDINTMEQLLAVTDLELEKLTEDFDDKVDFHGHRFMEYYREVVDNDLLTRQERSVVVQSCFNYMRSVGQRLLNRFPDLQFVLSHLAWVNPNN